MNNHTNTTAVARRKKEKEAYPAPYFEPLDAFRHVHILHAGSRSGKTTFCLLLALAEATAEEPLASMGI